MSILNRGDCTLPVMSRRECTFAAAMPHAPGGGSIVPSDVIDAVAGEPDDETKKAPLRRRNTPGKTLAHAPLLIQTGSILLEKIVSENCFSEALMRVRKKVSSGGMVPGNCRTALREVETMLAQARPADASARSGIIPHAGWAFSGRLALEVLSVLARGIDTIVIIGGHMPIRLIE